MQITRSSHQKPRTISCAWIPSIEAVRKKFKLIVKNKIKNEITWRNGIAIDMITIDPQYINVETLIALPRALASNISLGMSKAIGP